MAIPATYKPLLIAVGPYGVYSETGTWGNAFDTYETYGICVKSCPFTVCIEQKNIVTQDWTDKNGHDAYLPETPKYEAEEISLEFAIVDKGTDTNTKISSFISAITSKWLCMYDTYTKMGRKAVYLKGPDGQPEYWERNGKVILTFKLKFVVNSPVTNLTLNKGSQPVFNS